MMDLKNAAISTTNATTHVTENEKNVTKTLKNVYTMYVIWQQSMKRREEKY